MPKFRLTKEIDASIVYDTIIEAKDANEAAQRVDEDDSDLKWVEVNTREFDHRMAIEVIKLDENDIEYTDDQPEQEAYHQSYGEGWERMRDDGRRYYDEDKGSVEFEYEQ